MKTIVEIKSTDYWFKVVEMLQQNWALIDKTSIPCGCVVYFIHDLSGVFDRIQFSSEEEAFQALKRNGFARFSEDDGDEVKKFIAPPQPPFFKTQHPNGPIYSSGRYWQGDVNMYRVHPCDSWVSAYKKRPFQGQHPKDAKVIFLGRDANYSNAISSHSFFNRIIEYHDNGVKFWEIYGVHHPFLFDEYPNGRIYRDGVKYHKVFAKMCLNTQYAKYISFVELLDVPTCGNTGEDTNNVFYTSIDPEYIKKLCDWLLNTGDKIVFVSKMVINNDLRRVRQRTNGGFTWLLAANEELPNDEPHCILNQGNVKFYKCSHFSGAISNHHLCKMSNIIREFVDKFIK